MKPRGGGRWAWVLSAAVLLAGAGGIGYWWYFVRDAMLEPDMEEVLTLNNKGVGLMEQFRYDDAVPVFEEVVEKGPDWVPGRINLGIALYNTDEQSNLERALSVFRDVLAREPDNRHARYCTGLVLLYQKKNDEAAEHFEAVTRLDPSDACAWYYLGNARQDSDPEFMAECYRKALDLDPHHFTSLYGLAMHLRGTDQAKARELIAEWERLNARGTQWELLVSNKFVYGEVGQYAQVIAPHQPPEPVRPPPLPAFLPAESFKMELASGARWAKAEDFGEGDVEQVRARVRKRFGGTVVVLDYDRDEKPDLFVAGAVVEGGQVRDLLLRNEGEGRFVDVTAQAGLAAPHPTLGCSVGDFDNDDYPDLFLSGAGSQRLFRNNGKGGFEDMTEQAGLTKTTSVCLGSAFVDLDQDGDLDLLVAEYAAGPKEALKQLAGEAGPAGGSLAVFRNVGQAPPHQPSENQPPLSCAWERLDTVKELQGDPAPVVGVMASDLESDRDLDMVTLADRAPLAVALNDRVMRFRRQKIEEGLAPAVPWNGGCVLDVDQDGRSDWFLVCEGEKPRLVLNRSDVARKDVSAWLKPGLTNSPPLVQALVVDLDLDSRPDVVGLTEERLPILLRNEDDRLVRYRDALGRKEDWPADLLAVTLFPSGAEPRGVAGNRCGGVPDLLAWSESEGLLLRTNHGQGRHALRLELAGRITVHPAGLPSRCNADGVGTWVVLQSHDFWAGQEYTTLAAGLGQSRQPMLLGMGANERAPLLRLRWPDGVLQTELDLACGGPRAVVQVNRKSTSCPVLFAWDGEKYRFLTDFLGAGTVGEMNPDGSCRPPRPEESVKIEPGQLKPRDGYYSLSVAEPMDEIAYLDRLQLVVIDHPADTHVYPDERFATTGPPPTQEVFAFSERTFPSARDHRGRDLTRTLREWDRDTADGFAKSAWLGFAEEHFVELDFGDRLSRYGKDDRLFLCLAGWTDYAYPQSVLAAEQAGVKMLPPVLERQGADGKWEEVAEVGFPAGLPRMMTFEVTGKLAGPHGKLRLRTNLQVFWDQVFVAGRCRPVGEAGVRATTLEVARADLRPCGIMQEYAPDGNRPTVFAHDRYEAVPLNRLAGKLTRYGDVRELLTGGDDCFAIFGPGDELRVDFDARGLPALPSGWQRSFVLRTRGYCKGAGPFTATGTTVGPLPFAAMSNYPYGPDERYPDDEKHREYRRRYNTRVVVPDPFPRKSGQ